MSGINWDAVNEICFRKSSDFATAHPNFTVEAAYFAGYMENAAERESLRIIVDRMTEERGRLNTLSPVIVPAGALANLPPLPPGNLTISTLGSFM